MGKKTISYEDFDKAVKASYKLGLLDGRAENQKELNDIRLQLSNMLTTNKQLFKPMLDEHNNEVKDIKISPSLLRATLNALFTLNQVHPYFYLKRKYEAKTGEKFIHKRRRTKKCKK